jgi:hypothetical protein
MRTRPDQLPSFASGDLLTASSLQMLANALAPLIRGSEGASVHSPASIRVLLDDPMEICDDPLTDTPPSSLATVLQRKSDGSWAESDLQVQVFSEFDHAIDADTFCKAEWDSVTGRWEIYAANCDPSVREESL